MTPDTTREAVLEAADNVDCGCDADADVCALVSPAKLCSRRKAAATLRVLAEASEENTPSSKQNG